MTITCAAGEETKIADRIIRLGNKINDGEFVVVDADFESGITDISPAVV